MASPIIRADARDLNRLARNLRRAAPEAYKAYRVGAKAAAQPIVADAKQRASYSQRIPPTIKAQMTAGGSVKIVAGGEAAPDAAPIENKGKGFVRHPVFARGDRSTWTWTNVGSHPAYLAAAFDAKREQVIAAIELVVEVAVERALGGK